MKCKDFYVIILLTIMMTVFNPTDYMLKQLGRPSPQGQLAAAETDQEPKLVIGRSQSIPVFKSGEEGTLIIPVQNLHSGEARNVNVSLVVDEVDKFPFEMEKMSFQTGMSSIGAYSTKSAIFFGMRVAISAESKTYPIGVKVSYTSDNGVEGSVSDTIYVRIENDTQAPSLKFMGLQLEDNLIDSGESKTVELKIRNEGDKAARDVEIKLSGFTANGLRLDQDLDTFNLLEIPTREFKFIPFKLYADPVLESGSYALDLSMKYKDENSKAYSQEGKIYITVEGTGAEGNKKAAPKLIIDNYSYAGEYVLAGEIFPLQISFLNTHQDKEVNNIKVGLSFEENMFSPVNNSNSFFIDRIASGASVQRVVNLKPKFDAASKNYNITADIEYEDSKGNKYTTKELISIPVLQKSQLVASKIEIPEQCFAGMPLSISVDYYNTGRSTIRNLMIHAEGNFKSQDSGLYIGNLEAGHSDYYDLTITPENEGKINGKIIFDYDDETGRHFQSEKTFEINVMKQLSPPMPGAAAGMEKNSASPSWKKPVIIGAGIIAACTLAWIVRKRRVRKKEDVSWDE